MGANPTGLNREGRRDIYMFIHNVYANFFKDALDYFSLHLYPRFEYKVVGTYDKAVEYLNKQCELNREADKPNLPALILNPSGDFDLADANAGGRQLWRFPNLAPGMIKRIFDPVYQDENVEIDVGFIRMQGDLELLMLSNSFYEYCDLKMLFLQIFGGYERWIYPQFFTTFIILPEELVNYRYTNEYTGLSYVLDWESAGAYDKLVKTIARNELVLPCRIKPTYKLTSISDGSNRYGGADQIADWRLTATIRYEIEIPAFLVLQSDYLVQEIESRIKAGSAFSLTDYSEPPPTYEWGSTFEYDLGLDETSHSEINLDTTSEQVSQTEYEYNTQFFYTVTQADVDSTSNLNISLPFTVDTDNPILLYSRYGKMDYGDHWILTNNNKTIVVKKANVDLEVGMVIAIYLYKRKF
jgi:hypothetical protein